MQNPTFSLLLLCYCVHCNCYSAIYTKSLCNVGGG